ncbi:GFA family protein [Amylibacter sp. SFDW26]|uniref:GFA family protein n=1 Tax=Amylibacter sp. SFDW26 TaxID=2652722 RepID=UPI0012618882|nr:GFA family protein [Amylibacter sp. SFDW26]KAB7615890.1 GFA family protein [Amylibacter sp. SFDW26]
MSDTIETALECNCSICIRLGTIWGYSLIENVTIKSPPDGTIAYSRDQKNIAFHSCKNCGCTTHWEHLKPKADSKMAFNLRLSDPAILNSIRIRRFDGADTWSFIGE